jgi:hypothetical protein
VGGQAQRKAWISSPAAHLTNRAVTTGPLPG